MMLYKLLSRTRRSQFEPTVISLRPAGSISPLIGSLGVPVISLGMPRALPSPIGVAKLATHIRRISPDVIQGWMYHGNLAASFAKAATRSRSVLCWNVRQSLYRFSDERPITRMVIKLSARLSSFTDAVLYNSHTAARQHENLRFSPLKTHVIPNGFDTDTFRPDAVARSQVRAELGVSDDQYLIGVIGRFHPMKGHKTFLTAAARLSRIQPQSHFVLAGTDLTHSNEELVSFIRSLGLLSKVSLIGERRDIPRVLSALDIATSSSSWGEGFANVIGEAMSCGIPCIVTDIGDSARIVGRNEWVVPPDDPEALTSRWVELLSLGASARAKIGMEGRARIVEMYSLPAVVREYESLIGRNHVWCSGFFATPSPQQGGALFDFVADDDEAEASRARRFWGMD
jgi:glycosyltransferase involved in cell wall biosynthesis